VFSSYQPFICSTGSDSVILMQGKPITPGCSVSFVLRVVYLRTMGCGCISAGELPHEFLEQYRLQQQSDYCSGESHALTRFTFAMPNYWQHKLPTNERRQSTSCSGGDVTVQCGVPNRHSIFDSFMAYLTPKPSFCDWSHSYVYSTAFTNDVNNHYIDILQ
jgi:hypothetical protein